MPLTTCEAHGDDTIVAYNKIAYSPQQCPLCLIEEKLEVLEEKVESLTDQLDTAHRDYADARSEIESLEKAAEV